MVGLDVLETWFQQFTGVIGYAHPNTMNSELVNDMYDDCINYRSPVGRVSDRSNGSPRVCTTLLGLEVSCEEKQSILWD